METKDYYVLLYYCYTTIEDPEEFRERHHEFCIENDLRGRIIIAAEGINGTISGLKKNCDAYINHMRSQERFSNIDFKIDEHDQHAFKKLNVRLKEEIVNSSLTDINPNTKTGKYLEPENLKEFLEDPNSVIVDVRSNYEHHQGKFKKSITLDIDHFRYFPEKVNELSTLKDKKVVTVCTGGIKCEKASAYLLEKGFKDVYQLHGGIIKYGKYTDGELFDGKCYVFDNRLSVDINKKNPTVINQCYICNDNCDRMVNCANPKCNVHIPICHPCGEKLQGACSDKCYQHPEKREYDGTGYYEKNLNGYNPYKGLKRPS